MNKLIGLLIGLLFIPVLVRGLPAVDNDALPLGPSKYKYELLAVAKDKIVDTETTDPVTPAEIIKKNSDSRVFILGEFHDSLECHAFQKDFIEALFREHPDLVVGFEFFNRNDDQYLEMWRTGRITEEELLAKTDWYGRTAMNFGYTRLVMDLIKENRIKVIGLNVPRKMIRKVSMGGFKALAPEERKLFPTFSESNPDHQYFIKSIFGSFAVQLDQWFQNTYEAQKCWDVIMAESMRRVLSRNEFKKHKGVIIAGSAHVDYWLGIPFRYRAAERNVRMTTVVPVYLPVKADEDENDEVHPMAKVMASSLDPAAIVSRGIADYVFAVPVPDPPRFPVLGFSGKVTDGKYVISRVREGSLADVVGLRKGDKVLAVDDVPIETAARLRELLAEKDWGDRVELQLQKAIEIKKEECPAGTAEHQPESDRTAEKN